MEPKKIVARYADGRIIKGYTQNFFPSKPAFHIRPIEPKDWEQNVEIKIQELKGIFFVRDFIGNSNYQEQKAFPYGMNALGRKIEVTFKDGEVLVGSTLSYQNNKSGFFLTPSDPLWNTKGVFVVTQAVSVVRFI